MPTALLAVLLLAACGPASRTVTVDLSEDEVVMRQAAALVSQGHYTAFAKAVRLYADLCGRRPLRARVAAPYLEACLLLGLREKDLGIEDPATLNTAARLIAEHRDLARQSPYLTLISRVPLRTRGVMRDIDTSTWNEAGRQNLEEAVAETKGRAATDGFAAYVLSAWFCGSGGAAANLGESFDPEAYLRAWPDSLLLKYEAAVCGGERPRLLKEILEGNPDFGEAYYHLGEAALKEGRLLDAEGKLVKAQAALPESPQPPILLAGISFAMEEFARALGLYDTTLRLSPEYRDAVLGKAICLGYLGRHDEAMRQLGRLLDLGYWLVGESHYWLAWNLHALGRDAEALVHVDEAKGRLPTNANVFALAGTIALDLGEAGRAEKDYLEALVHDPVETESLLGLGAVATRQNRWPEAAGYFERAARALGDGVGALRAKVGEVDKSALADDRKAGLLRKKRSQLERTRLAEASAWYDAAAAFFNAGDKAEALEAAAKSASHPALKDKTDELLRSIQK
jgi:tetratricopeptide (TPR) repeat protein